MQDINNGIIKLVSSLAVKKYRDKEGLFVAEGWKCVRDTWHAFNCRYLIATRAWYEQQGTAEHYHKIVFANKGQMAKMSQFTTASDVMAVYEELKKNQYGQYLKAVIDEKYLDVVHTDIMDFKNK